MIELQDKEDKEDDKAIFNMAIDTLRRLGKNLEQQKELEYKILIPTGERQLIKIGLVKQFFVQASPLLGEDAVGNYKKEILGLKPVTVIPVEHRYYQSPKNYPPVLMFDLKLAIRLDEIVIELQMILQKSGYFMPSGEDEGDF